MTAYSLLVLPDRFVISRFPLGTPFDTNIPASGKFYAWIQEIDSLTIISDESTAAHGVEKSSGWRAMRVAGNLDFSLVGILAGISSTLAGAGISIFAISTYATDYILVKEEKLLQAVDALQDKGYQVITADEV